MASHSACTYRVAVRVGGWSRVVPGLGRAGKLGAHLCAPRHPGGWSRMVPSAQDPARDRGDPLAWGLEPTLGHTLKLLFPANFAGQFCRALCSALSEFDVSGKRRLPNNFKKIHALFCCLLPLAD